MSRNIRQTVTQTFHNLLEQNDITLQKEITDDCVLLETGLDSLGYATLVTMLEVELGYDPFVLNEEPIYPTTFGEFVAIYEKYQDHAS